MGNVVRIPTQHRSLPHCPDVDEDLYVVDLIYPPSCAREFR